MNTRAALIISALALATPLGACGHSNNNPPPATTIVTPTTVTSPGLAPPPAPALPAPAGPPITSINPGSYAIGTGPGEVPAGTYHTQGPIKGRNSCYWARQSAGSPTVIASGNLTGPGSVGIVPTDGVFQTDGCQPFERQH